ncbi:MAG TPA: hypothetical protein PJ986_16530 [Gammaproteobacteria bacterium]|mgnify:CR=1 FL=1|nr:hypothetical protein [Gammaproteobacteria bacterium]
MTRSAHFPLVCRWPLACAALLVALPLQAGVLAQMPLLPVGNGGPNTAGLSAHYSVAASTAGDADFASDLKQTYPPDWTTTLTASTNVVGVHPSDTSRNSTAEIGGIASFGSLRGHTTASFEIIGNADAVLRLAFLDTLQVDKEGLLNFSFQVSGEVGKTVHPIFSNVFAASSAVAELFIWRYGEQPAAGSFFNFESYGRFTYRPNEATVMRRAEGIRAAPGSRWVVAGTVYMESHAFGNQQLIATLPPSALSSSADFRHTATLLITPDPSTPDVSFTSASGARYDGASPVPLPGALPLFGLCALTLRPRFRRHRSFRSPGAA